MVQNNKVLTVSYGTFSCTLEGFEDSFDTMKAIAEYFRDLAADDRYFGAEPPQPDADMLARIAQREISRQVEARQSDQGIVLTAAEPAVAAPAAAIVERAPKEEAAAPIETPSQEAAVQPAKPLESEDTAVPADSAEEPEVAAVEDDVQPVDAAAAEVIDVAEIEEETALSDEETPSEASEAASPAIEMPAAIEMSAESDAAPQIEDIVEDTAEAEDDENEEPAEEAASTEPLILAADDQFEDEDAAAAEEISIAPAADPEPEPTAEDNDDAALAALSARLADPDFEPEVTEAEPVEDKAEIVPAADSIAAKLQRIRAVVSRNEKKAAQEETYSEDEHAEDVLSDAVAEVEDDEDVAEIPVEPTVESEAGELEVNEAANEDDPILARVDEVLATDEVPATVKEDEVEPEAETETAKRETVTEDDALFADLDAEDDDDADDELGNILEDEEQRPAAKRPSAPRVVKVKTRDLEAILDGDDGGDGAGTAVAPEGSLSPEDEADLLRELAEVEAELEGKPLTDEVEGETVEAAEDATSTQDEETRDATFEDDMAAEAAPQDDEQAQEEAAPSADSDENDLSRLMATADEKLDDPDLSTNRETYSHLRAAVAAAQAERSAGGTVGMHSSDDDYRDDLAQAVRPRRPVASGARSRPRAEDRPAPLKLVAEQRIDTPTATEQRGPIRPRRVANLVQEDAENTSEGGFAEFAAENGAVALPDLLEAAAAYMSFVEGRDQFSRPQLMNKVRQLDNQEFNREDGLRSFGQLLRDGKIEKTGGGRFTASRQIGYRPDNRAAG